MRYREIGKLSEIKHQILPSDQPQIKLSERNSCRVQDLIVVAQFPVTLNDYLLVRPFLSINEQGDECGLSIKVVVVLHEDHEYDLAHGIPWVKLHGVSGL